MKLFLHHDYELLVVQDIILVMHHLDNCFFQTPAAQQPAVSRAYYRGAERLGDDKQERQRGAEDIAQAMGAVKLEASDNGDSGNYRMLVW